MSANAALRAPALRRYLLGQLPSVTCSWIQVVALSWIVVDRYPMALGTVVALQFAPSVLCGPWFGAVADRYDRRLTLIVAETGLGLVAAAYAIAAASDRLDLTVIYVLAAAWGLVNALDTPARQALVPALVPAGLAASAAALSGVVLLLGMTVGSALGALVVGAAGVGVAFTLNAASFLLDVVLLATIRIRATPRADQAPLLEGLVHVMRTPRLRASLVALALLGTLTFTVQVSVPLLLRTSFDADAFQLGTGITAVAAGGIAGAAAAAVRGSPRPGSMRRASAGLAAAASVTAVASTPPVLLAALAGLGAAWSLLVASAIAHLQTAEPAKLGRVMSWLGVVLVGGTAVGGPLAAAIAAYGGPRAPFMIGAVAAAIVAAATSPRLFISSGQGAGRVSARPASTTHPISR